MHICYTHICYTHDINGLIACSAIQLHKHPYICTDQAAALMSGEQEYTSLRSPKRDIEPRETYTDYGS